jgi:hypothetical protein
MKHTLWAVLICLLSISAKAQTAYSVKGSVADTSMMAPLVNTSVSVLNAKDSTLVKFTRTNNEGEFAIGNLKSGKYLLLVTYPKYADYVDNFALDSSKQSIDFKRISMLLKSKLLADVIIKGKVAAIKIKGDTTEFNAGSFVIEPNSKVEDLLKQLPGIQVDKDGKITAQGQTVNKVLVDGEEFFGDDPTLVTKNLRADMVDKVQLYDKKSDQATFTGIDDGERTKTLNIKLKEDKKNGYFGKVDAGGGSGEFYQGQAMINAFKAKQKFAAYGILANTSKIGLGWEDRNKYGTGNVEMSEDGDLNFNNGNDDLNYNNQGIPSAQSGGVHYEQKWNKDKESINTNYKVGGLSINGNRTNLSQNILPQGVIGSSDDELFNNDIFRQKLDATYQLKIDSTSNLKLIADATIKNIKSNKRNSVFGTRADDTRQNSNLSSFLNEADHQSFFASAFYNKKLKKKGRTYSVSLSQTLNTQEDDGFLYSDVDYFETNGTRSGGQDIDQRKTFSSTGSVFNSNVTYTEPLTKKFSLVLNYGININNATSDRKSFNQDPGNDNQYNVLDEAFSNNFKLNQIANQGGSIINYKNGKSNANFGTKLARVQFNQVDLNSGINLNRNFWNYRPQASYEYKFSQFKRLSIRYNGNTVQPTISQIQPIANNIDALNISEGNGSLKPSFKNKLEANYGSYKVVASRYIGGFATYTVNSNPIIFSRETDDKKGRSNFSYENLPGKSTSNFFMNTEYSKKIEALGFNLGLWVNLSRNLNYNRINDVLNKLESRYIGTGLTAHKQIEKKYAFWLSVGPRYNTYKTTLPLPLNNNGGGFNSNGHLQVHLPGKVEVSTGFEYNHTNRTQAFNDDFGFFVMNSSITKKFFKDERLRFSVSGNDLLNQNRGFNRNANDNFLTQSSHNTINRYLLFSLIWDFNKMGGGLKPKN